MARDIIIPKGARDPVLDRMEETWLGHPKGSKKQYRHGRLHIREYEDHYAVHEDAVDPRRDPLGHILLDAPEILAGVAGGAIGVYAGSAVRKRTGSALAGAAAGAVLAPLLFKLGMDAANALKGR